jgi:outer membrane receptor protein involved in Fe transport
MLVPLVPSPSLARTATAQRVSLRPQPLKAALQEVARRYKIELLFSNDVVVARDAPAISGDFTAEQALHALLAGSGLQLKGSVEVGFVVAPADIAGPQVPPPVPDILVVGKRTQNTDIQRRSNDVQPYQVLTRELVHSSHARTLEELLGKYSSQDALGLTLAQQPISSAGAPRSNFNLRGLGLEDTLVLVDGRPMPRVPGQGFVLGQADVNALSPEAIERAEVLTSTAGGIYGPGAIGGVVNLVLRRDYRGAEVAATSGLTSRGDGLYRRLDARLGFTPDHGGTDIQISYSRATGDGLTNGDRGFAENERRLRYASAVPYSWSELPLSNSANVASLDGQSLTLKAAYGGQSLGSNISYLSPQDARSASGLGAALSAHAGSLDLSLPDGKSGCESSLVAGQRSSMVLFNVRHKFGSGLEAYVDLIRLDNQGRVDYAQAGIYQQLSASDPRNPFDQDIEVVRAVPGLGTSGGTRTLTTRVSAGAIVELPEGWRSNIDYSVGSVRQRTAFSGTTYGLNALYALYGIPLAGYPAIDPLANAADFGAAMADYAVPTRYRFKQVNRMSDGAARFAGPLADLGAGPITATVLLEQRKERVAESRYDELISPYGIPNGDTVPGYSERIRSAYLELRAPMLGDMTGPAPKRGLELQLAVRRDATQVRLQAGYLQDQTGATDAFDKAGRTAMTYTFGARGLVLPGVLLRASIATGEQTPPIRELTGAYVIGQNGPDPKRGNTVIQAPYDLVMFSGGKITPERARALSAGVVFTPFRPDGPSFSLDYTHLRRSREVDGRFIGNAGYFLYHEDDYPGRVTRLPLSAEDAGRGYTGGVITRIDTSFLNLGWTVIDAVDVRAVYPVRTAALGDFTFRANVTWQPRFTRLLTAENPAVDYVDYADGALEWRGNGGIDWANGPMSLSFNGQFYGRYRAIFSGTTPSLKASILASQGREWIAAQAVFDLALAYRVEMPGHTSRPRFMDFRFGVLDIFDHRPATVVTAEGSYSYYANPLRRRFELTVAMEI